jgi:hypothetical protein
MRTKDDARPHVCHCEEHHAKSAIADLEKGDEAIQGKLIVL